MKRITVLVLADPDLPQRSMLDELRDSAHIVIGNSPEAFKQSAADAEVIFLWSSALSLLREVFLECPRLRWIHSRPVGLDRTLFPELVTSEVTLTNGRTVFSPSLGEFALAAILFFAKGFRRLIRNQMASLWEPFDVAMVRGQTVGIVGYGDIGRAVAELVRAVGMHVLALKRHTAPPPADDPLAEEIFPPNGRLEMLGRCDYVVVAAPLNAETRGLIGPTEFAAMKQTAVLINVGRGPVVQEKAMIDALTLHKIKGAALDVFDEEPLPKGHPFYALENVLLSPHCADHTRDWHADAMRFFITQFNRFRTGQPLLNVVNKVLGY
ncbi:MAG TPA: D-2-hydroxyacid dehydrogenase [Candidatus Cybelea sp.]|nr:D-2-hydroxyacid dehydrogenase [Candidatus Cybelea sp.]